MVYGGFTVTERLLSPEIIERPSADWTCAPQEETAHDLSPATLDRGRRRTKAALKAIRELARWLYISDAQAARYVGHLRNYYNWLKGEFHPSPASLAGIHEAHALVESLVKAEGEEQARVWLKAYTGGKPRQEYLADSTGRAELARLARDMLFPPAPVIRWEPDEGLEYDAPPPPASNPTASLRSGAALPPKTV
jgi:hypothetical protein